MIESIDQQANDKTIGEIHEREGRILATEINQNRETRKKEENKLKYVHQEKWPANPL